MEEGPLGRQVESDLTSTQDWGTLETLWVRESCDHTVI